MDCIICRYGELALKGKNRGLFENQLVTNIRDCLSRNGVSAKITKVRGRIFVFTVDKDALVHLKNVFGLVSISSAVVCESTQEDIKKTVVGYVENIIKDSKPVTFRISTKRTDKNFQISSGDMDVSLGNVVGTTFKLKAKMKGADLDIGVEIHDKTFIFHDKVDCYGGLPLGTGGNVACLIEKKEDLAAAWIFMRRGCTAFPVVMGNINISPLSHFAYGTDIISSAISNLAEANVIIEKRKCRAVVIGCLFEEFEPEQYDVIDAVVLAPLIGFDAQQRSALLEKIS